MRYRHLLLFNHLWIIAIVVGHYRTHPEQTPKRWAFLSPWTAPALDASPLARLAVGSVVHRRHGPVWAKHHPLPKPCHAACPVSPYSGTAGGSRDMPALASTSSAMGGALEARGALAANRRCALSCCLCWRARSFSRF